MYLIETPLGRRGTLALTTLGTSVSLYLFTKASTQLAQLIASCGAAVLQNAMYGVLYCYTPELFDSRMRGTAGEMREGICLFVFCFLNDPHPKKKQTNKHC